MGDGLTRGDIDRMSRGLSGRMSSLYSKRGGPAAPRTSAPGTMISDDDIERGGAIERDTPLPEMLDGREIDDRMLQGFAEKPSPARRKRSRFTGDDDEQQSMPPPLQRARGGRGASRAVQKRRAVASNFTPLKEDARLHWSGSKTGNYPFTGSLPPASERIHIFFPSTEIWRPGGRRFVDCKNTEKARRYLALFVFLCECVGRTSRVGTRSGWHVADGNGGYEDKVSTLVQLIVRNNGKRSFNGAAHKPDTYALIDQRNHVGLLFTCSIRDPKLKFYELVAELIDDIKMHVPVERRRYVMYMPTLSSQHPPEEGADMDVDETQASAIVDGDVDMDDSSGPQVRGGNNTSKAKESRRKRRSRRDDSSDEEDDEESSDSDSRDESDDSERSKHHHHRHSDDEAEEVSESEAEREEEEGAGGSSSKKKSKKGGKKGKDAETPDGAAIDAAVLAEMKREQRMKDRQSQQRAKMSKKKGKEKPHTKREELYAEEIAKNPAVLIETIDCMQRALQLIIDTATDSQKISGNSKCWDCPDTLMRMLESDDPAVSFSKILSLDTAIALANKEARRQVEELRSSKDTAQTEQCIPEDEGTITYTEINSTQLTSSAYLRDPEAVLSSLALQAVQQQKQRPTLAAAAASPALGKSQQQPQSLDDMIQRTEDVAKSNPELTSMFRSGYAPHSLATHRACADISNEIDICSVFQWIKTRRIEDTDDAVGLGFENTHAYDSFSTSTVVCKLKDRLTECIGYYNASANMASIDDSALIGYPSEYGDRDEAIMDDASVAEIGGECCSWVVQDGADSAFAMVAPDPNLAWLVEPWQLEASRLSKTILPWCSQSVPMLLAEIVAGITKEPVAAVALGAYNRRVDSTNGTDDSAKIANERLDIPRVPSKCGAAFGDWTMLGLNREVVANEISFVGIAARKMCDYINRRYEACMRDEEEEDADGDIGSESPRFGRDGIRSHPPSPMASPMRTGGSRRDQQHQVTAGRRSCACGIINCCGGKKKELCIMHKLYKEDPRDFDSHMRQRLIRATMRAAMRETAIRYDENSMVPDAVKVIGKWLDDRIGVALPFLHCTSNVGMMPSTQINFTALFSEAHVTSNHLAIILLMQAREIACLGGVSGALALNVKFIGPYGAGKSAALLYVLLTSIPDGSVQQLNGASSCAILPLYPDKPYGECIVFMDELLEVFTLPQNRLKGRDGSIQRQLNTAITDNKIIYFHTTKVADSANKELTQIRRASTELHAVFAYAGATNDKDFDTAVSNRMITWRVTSDTDTRSAAKMMTAVMPTGKTDLTAAANSLCIHPRIIDALYCFNALCFVACEAIQGGGLPIPERSMVKVMLTIAADILQETVPLSPRKLSLAWPMSASLCVHTAVSRCFTLNHNDPDAVLRKFNLENISIIGPHLHADQDITFFVIAFCILQAIDPLFFDIANWMLTSCAGYSAGCDYHMKSLNVMDGGKRQAAVSKFKYDNKKPTPPRRIKWRTLEEAKARMFTPSKQAMTSPFIPEDYDPIAMLKRQASSFSSRTGRRTGSAAASGGARSRGGMSSATDGQRRGGTGGSREQRGGASGGMDMADIRREREFINDMKALVFGTVIKNRYHHQGDEDDEYSDEGAIMQRQRDSRAAVDEISAAARRPDSFVDDDSQASMSDINAAFNTSEGLKLIMENMATIPKDTIIGLTERLKEIEHMAASCSSAAMHEYVPFSRATVDAAKMSEVAFQGLIDGTCMTNLLFQWKYKTVYIDGQDMYDVNYVCVNERAPTLVRKISQRKYAKKMTEEDISATLVSMCEKTYSAHLLPHVQFGDIASLCDVERFRTAMWNDPRCKQEPAPILIPDVDCTYVLIEVGVMNPLAITRKLLRMLCNSDTYPTCTIMPTMTPSDPGVFETFDATCEDRTLSLENPLRLPPEANRLLRNIIDPSEVAESTNKFEWGKGSELAMLRKMFDRYGYIHPELHTYEALRKQMEETFFDESETPLRYPFPITNIKKLAESIQERDAWDIIADETTRASLADSTRSPIEPQQQPLRPIASETRSISAIDTETSDSSTPLLHPIGVTSDTADSCDVSLDTSCRPIQQQQRHGPDIAQSS